MVGFHNSATVTKKKIPQLLRKFYLIFLYLSWMCPQCVHRRDHLRPLLYSWAAMTWSILRIAHCSDASAQLVHDAREH